MERNRVRKNIHVYFKLVLTVNKVAVINDKNDIVFLVCICITQVVISNEKKL